MGYIWKKRTKLHVFSGMDLYNHSNKKHDYGKTQQGKTRLCPCTVTILRLSTFRFLRESVTPKNYTLNASAFCQNVRFPGICSFKACLHGGGGPQEGEVTCLGGVTCQSICDHV